MNLRLIGTPEQVRVAVSLIGLVLDVTRVGKPRPSRHNDGQVLVYASVAPPKSAEVRL